jgi:hypothetical protein
MSKSPVIQVAGLFLLTFTGTAKIIRLVIAETVLLINCLPDTNLFL